MFNLQISITKINIIHQTSTSIWFSGSLAQINQILKLISNKGTDPDCIPLRVIKTVANVIDLHLAKIVNKVLAEKLLEAKTTLDEFTRKTRGIKH